MFNSTGSEPEIQPIALEMPVDEGSCWFLTWSDQDYQSIARCAYQILPEYEFVVGLKLANQSVALQYWCSRITLRHSLTRYTLFSRQPNEWKLLKSESGKLKIDDAEGCYRDIDFSISHIKGLTACAVSSGSYIGIDVESLHRDFDSNLISRKIFSSTELKIIGHTKNNERARTALKLWTLKEACSKAVGLGLEMDYSRIEFELTPQGRFTVCNHFISEFRPVCRWRVNQHVLNDMYYLSLSGATPVDCSGIN